MRTQIQLTELRIKERSECDRIHFHHVELRGQIRAELYRELALFQSQYYEAKDALTKEMQQVYYRRIALTNAEKPDASAVKECDEEMATLKARRSRLSEDLNEQQHLARMKNRDALAASVREELTTIEEVKSRIHEERKKLLSNIGKAEE